MAMQEVQFGVRHSLGAPIVTTRYAEQALLPVPPRGRKFTQEEWELNNDMRCRNTEDQQQLADRVLAASEHIMYETGERSGVMQATTMRRLEERVGDVKFNRDELLVQKKEIYYELESLGMYKVRLQDCLASLKQNALAICQKCIVLRDQRQGIDLVVDDIEKALQTELNTIVGSQSLLTRALEQLNEQMRRLRSAQYLLDRDLANKQAAIDADTQCITLKPTDSCLAVYEGYASMDPADITADEYNIYSANNIKRAGQEVASARPIKIYIDNLIKQTFSDLWAAYRNCNNAFNDRIRHTRKMKEKYEEMHLVTSTKILDMQKNIMNLKKALVSKEGDVGLAHTRLGKRAQRRELELVKDPASVSLFRECELLRYSVEQLQLMLYESSASLRYLLQTQIQLEEDINVKMNTLKIDEVDCMSLRQIMEYHQY